MPFKKGVSGNAKGKPKGVKNRTTEEIRLAIAKLVDNNIDKLQQDIDSLQPKDRVTLMLGLMNFILPKYQAVGVQDFTQGNVTVYIGGEPLSPD